MYIVHHVIGFCAVKCSGIVLELWIRNRKMQSEKERQRKHVMGLSLSSPSVGASLPKQTCRIRTTSRKLSSVFIRKSGIRESRPRISWMLFLPRIPQVYCLRVYFEGRNQDRYQRSQPCGRCSELPMSIAPEEIFSIIAQARSFQANQYPVERGCAFLNPRDSSRDRLCWAIDPC